MKLEVMENMVISKEISFNSIHVFDKKFTGSSVMSYQQLANELHKSIIRKLFKKRVYSWFKDNIWGVDLADMQLVSKCKKGIRYLLCAIDFFSKYARVIPLKDKKGITIVNASQNILDSSKRKPDKIKVVNFITG